MGQPDGPTWAEVDAPLRTRLSAAGPAQAANFSWEREAMRTLAVYESIRPASALLNRSPD